MRIAVVDTYYQGVLDSWKVHPENGYTQELRRLLDFSFGTADFYSAGLQAQDCVAIDIIANATELQKLWAHDAYFGEKAGLKAIALQQIEDFHPDVVFMQNLSWFSPADLEQLGKKYLLAGQCSCPMPNEANVRKFDVIFTSFPHYVARFEAMGVRAVFNPLAFDPIVLERMGPVSGERSGVVFVGGVGSPSHWKAGMEVLETVAREIPEFSWYGYGVETLPADSPLRPCYKGQAWGLDYYRVMANAAIVLNRHGEVSGDYANNMRMFETTGVGALLLTDAKSNLRDYFGFNECEYYLSAESAVGIIRACLKYPDAARKVAENGQRRTLKDHTYAQRMKTVADALKEAMVSA